MSIPRSIVVWLLLAVVCVACGLDDGASDLWQGSAADLVGAWRDRDLSPSGRAYLVFDLSGVYREVLDAPTQALETQRGSYVVEAGILVRIPTRHIDPSQIGRRTENGIYAADDDEIILEPSRAGGAQIFYQRVGSVPTYNELQ